MQTGSMFGALSDGAKSSEERIEAQPGKLAEIALAVRRAERIRLYGLEDDREALLQAGVSQYLAAEKGAHDLDFSADPRLLEFLADARRTMPQVRGDAFYPPAYDDLLCFFSDWREVGFEWCEHATLLYLANPRKGMSRRAVTESQKYLKTNPGACILALSMTSMRSSVIVFPGDDAMDSVWGAMTASRIKEGH